MLPLNNINGTLATTHDDMTLFTVQTSSKNNQNVKNIL